MRGSAKIRFLAQWLACALAIVFLAAALNRLVDPYGLHAGPRWPGFNVLKARPDLVLADIKLAGALRIRPDAVILGNSRADIGLDPQQLVRHHLAARPYNLAVPGGGLETSVRQLETLLAEGVRPRIAIVGVEFLDYFNSGSAVPESMPDRAADWGRRSRQMLLQSLFTLTALADSFATIRAQYSAYPATVRADGFDPLLEYQALARSDGYHALFRQRALDYAERLKAAKYPADAHATPSHAALERLLRVARDHDIRMEFAIYPYHAQILGMLEHYGLLADFVSWKMDVAETVARAAAAGAPVRLWDFATLDAPSTERIPAAGDRTTDTAWYWEAGHFKPALGNLMLERMLAEGVVSRTGFGRLLAPGPVPGPVPPDADLARRVHALLARRADLAADLAQIFAYTR